MGLSQKLMVGCGALFAPIAWLGAATAVAESPGGSHTAAITPVFAQLVMFSLPAEFSTPKPTYEKNSGSFYIREQVADGETRSKWTRMITLTGTRGLAANPAATPQALLARMTADFQRNCPDSFSTAAPGAQKVDGYDAYAVIASCGRLQSDNRTFSESAIMLTVKGSNDYYTLQWTERGRDSAQPLPIDVAYWTKQLARLNPIKLCPVVPGEAAPYRSCAAR
jgi:hypothetical protein